MSARATLLSILRGPDGRRLAAVVAAVMVVAGFLGGVSAGQAAGGAGLSIFCKADEGAVGGAPATPAGQSHADCCIGGHNTAAGALVPDAVPLSVVFAPGSQTAVASTDRVIVPLARASDGPRGPPLDG
ncbi:MAG: hypothetical protein ABI399_00700 [Bauldia sp.]